MPEEHKFSEKMLDVIRVMLTPDPALRPNIFEVCKILANYNHFTTIPLNVNIQLFSSKFCRDKPKELRINRLKDIKEVKKL